MEIPTFPVQRSNEVLFAETQPERRSERRVQHLNFYGEWETGVHWGGKICKRRHH